MKILLVNPSNAFNGYHVPKLLRKMHFLSKHLNFSSGSLFPPLNLALMAAYVPPDMEVEIMDGCIEPIDYTREADLVGITALTGNIVTAYETADRFRARGTAVVMGGNHPTVLPQEALEHSDAVVVGEGGLEREHLVQRHAKGIDVRAMVQHDAIAGSLLGRHVAKRAQQVARHGVQRQGKAGHVATVQHVARERIRAQERIDKLLALEGPIKVVQTDVAGNDTPAAEAREAFNQLLLTL